MPKTALYKRGAKVMRAQGKSRKADTRTTATKAKFSVWKENPSQYDLVDSKNRFVNLDNKAGAAKRRRAPRTSAAKKVVAVRMPSGAVVAVKARKPLTQKQLDNLAWYRQQRSLNSKANRGYIGEGYGIGSIDGVRLAGPAGPPSAVPVPEVAKLAASAGRPANPYESAGGFNEARRTGNPYEMGM